MSVKLLTTKELRSKKPAEIAKYVESLKVERVELIHSLQSGKSKSTHRLSQMKRSIATALTVSKEAQAAQTKENK